MSTISVDLQNALGSTKPKIIISLLIAIVAHIFAALCLWLFLPWPKYLPIPRSNTVITVNTIQSREAKSPTRTKRIEENAQTIVPEKNISEQKTLPQSQADSTNEHIAHSNPSNTFGALPVPQKLLGRGLFPRKYSVSWSCHNSTSNAKLLTFVSKEQPITYIDNTMRAEFAILLSRRFAAAPNPIATPECMQKAEITFTEW